MAERRFDALTKALADRTSRRRALLGGGVVVVAIGRAARRDRGSAQDAGTPAATPAASPGATPGLLDVLSGTPPATNDPSAQGRHIGLGGPLYANCCKNPEQCELRDGAYVCV